VLGANAIEASFVSREKARQLIRRDKEIDGGDDEQDDAEQGQYQLHGWTLFVSGKNLYVIPGREPTGPAPQATDGVAARLCDIRNLALRRSGRIMRAARAPLYKGAGHENLAGNVWYRSGRCNGVFGLAAVLWPAPARATELIIVDQSMLRFVCMFDADCNSRDTPSDIGALPTARPGSDPRLQSFSFEAKSGTPADGSTVYVYRVDLTKAEPYTECLAGLVLNFGPPAQMPFAIANVAHIFVITTGGNGTVAVKSAEQDGDFIQFNFKDPVCPGESSMFYSLMLY
jgi:hypothetical protein